MSIIYDYYPEADILEIFFSEAEATATLNLTPDIILHFQAETAQPVSLILNNVTSLTQPTEYGWHSFLLQPQPQSRVLPAVTWHMLTTFPLNEWLTLTAYHAPHQLEVIPLLTIRTPQSLSTIETNTLLQRV